MKQLIVWITLAAFLLAAESEQCLSYDSEAFKAVLERDKSEMKIEEVLLFIPEKFVRADPLVLYVKDGERLYKQPWIFCEEKKGDYTCSVEDDGGRFLLTKEGEIVSLSLTFLKESRGEYQDPKALFTLRTKVSKAVEGDQSVCPGQRSSYRFNVKRKLSAKLSVLWYEHRIEVEIKGEKYLIEGLSEDFREWHIFSVETMKFEDINFDGYRDIALTVGIGYGGVNVVRDYYIYRPESNRFKKVLQNVSNLVRHPKAHLLSSQMKSGPGSSVGYYRITKQGIPYLIIKIEQYWPKEEETEMKRVYTTKNLRVAKNKTYFYDLPGIKRSKVYIIKNDKVLLQDIKQGKEGSLWAKVIYKSRKKTYVKWVKLSDLAFDMLDPEPEYTEENKNEKY